MLHPKQIIAFFLRKTRLLTVVDFCKFQVTKAHHCFSNRTFIASHPNFIAPPTNVAFDAYNHTNWEIYYDSGKIHATLISDLVKKYRDTDEVSILEWGCGPVRVLQHLPELLAPKTVTLSGSDYNRESIAWCSANYPKITFKDNDLQPPLQFEDNQFDCVFALSIFTHLSEENHFAWVKELTRVLKPGGILIFTTHGTRCIEGRLLPHEMKEFNEGKLVSRKDVQEGKKLFASYHPIAFVKEVLLKDYSILEYMEDASAYQLHQDVWVVKKS